MLNPITNERELAYIVKVDEVKELPGYDKIAHYRINDWWCVSGKGDYQVGDLALYIEIDSLCPYTPEFSFLDMAFLEGGKKRPDRHKIKTQKFCKGTAISQGLLCPLKDFPSLKNVKLGDFVTKTLGITYYEAEDNARKADNSKYTSMQARHKKFFKTKFGKWLMRREWGRKLCFFFLGKKKDKKTDWPQWVKKTDEERCQNCFSSMKALNQSWLVTEKIDGTSTTFTMKQAKPKKRKLIVCSRNVVFNTPEKENKNFYRDSDGNVYLEMAKKYEMKEFLGFVLGCNPNWEWLTIQGETYGGSIQKRNYGDKHDFAVFNVIYKRKNEEPVKLNPYEIKDFLKYYNEEAHFCLKSVPVLCEMTLPETCEELLEYAASAPSQIDGGMREGIVLRSSDAKYSFKAVSNEFLLKYHG